MGLFKVLFAAAFLGFAVHPLLADPIYGSTVNGAFYIAGTSAPNFFAVANGGSGTTATIGPGVEFSSAYLGGTAAADFTANGLGIQFVLDPNYSYAHELEFSFTDPSFTGFAQLTDFSNFSYTYTGDVLDIYFKDATSVAPGTYDATFKYNIAATPEPSSLLLMGTGLIAACGVISRRRRALNA